MMIKENVVKHDIADEIRMEKRASVQMFQPQPKITTEAKDKDDKPSKV